MIQKATVFLKKLKGEIKPRKKWNHKFRSWPFLTDHWDSDTESKMIKKEHLIEVGNFLCYYHDPTYGQLLQKGKRKGHFDDVLVYSVADMIKESEFYNKATWVTSVPSLNHLNLVPEFASKVAEAIEKPYINSVKKIRGTEQQKNMINSFHQQKNLDGSFEVTQVRSEPVILIDDIVDSRFTLTIIGALLRNAGCEAVYPITIGSSSKW